MKLKIFNGVSGICFLLSSASLLFIPFLNLEDEFPAVAYYLAGTFWGGLIVGIALQILLWSICRKRQKNRNLKKLKLITAILFGAFVLSGIIIFCSFSNNKLTLIFHTTFWFSKPLLMNKMIVNNFNFLIMDRKLSPKL